MPLDQALVERVLTVVGRIPAGNVSTYGEVAKCAGVGPRYVGRVLRVHGADAPWWRVIRSDATSHDPHRAVEHWRREDIEFHGDPPKVVMHRHGLDHHDLDYAGNGTDIQQS